MGDAGDYTTVSAEWLRAVGVEVYVKCGVPREDAEVMVDCLVETDLRGVHSHGMLRLGVYAERLANGGTNPRPNIRIVEESPGTAVVEGDNGLGMVVSKRCMDLAIEKASQVGIGAVCARHSDHYGPSAYWAMMALEHDMIGLATTNGVNVMAPWGGLTRSLGNDPLGVAVPAGKARPLVLDMATSVVAVGKLAVAQAKGEKIPFGWALATDGTPTDDPTVGRAGLALPIGEYKGYGLTVIFEVLAGVLSGAAYSRHVPKMDPKVPIGNGHFFLAIDISRFMPVDDFKARVDDLINLMKTSELAPGFDEILVPGEPEHDKWEKYSAQGIPMISTVIDDVKALAAKLGVDVPPMA